MISFYPGPSQLDSKIDTYLQDAVKEGILQANHRSEDFMSLYRYTTDLLHRKWALPKDYSVIFTSSATEWWEIVAQSLTKQESLHLGNGAFAEKWFQFAKAIHQGSRYVPFAPGHWLEPSSLGASPEVLAITQNETSNGTQVPLWLIREYREAFPEAILAVDATSSLGGVCFDFQMADVWFGSVQKCMGLPAGLGIGLISSRAVSRAKEIGNAHYNSLMRMVENADKFQTHYTPNVLGIYLFMRVLKSRPSLAKTAAKLEQRATALYRFFEEDTPYPPLIPSGGLRSDTVLCLQATEENLAALFPKSKKKGISLGKGYGQWKGNTFRIANFPALKTKHFQKLKSFFKRK